MVDDALDQELREIGDASGVAITLGSTRHVGFDGLDSVTVGITMAFGGVLGSMLPLIGQDLWAAIKRLARRDIREHGAAACQIAIVTRHVQHEVRYVCLIEDPEQLDGLRRALEEEVAASDAGRASVTTAMSANSVTYVLEPSGWKRLEC